MRRFLAVSAVCVLSACSPVQSALSPAGDQAGRLWALFLLMACVCGFFYILVATGLFWAVVRRKGHLSPEAGAERRLDVGLGIWIGLVTAGLSLLVAGSFLADRELAAKADGTDPDILVTAHQWWWRFQYRDPAGGGWIQTANELHVPAGRTMRVALRSADVIHSFWAPTLAGKMDVIPGRDNRLTITARREGWYRGQCTEFCGAQHAHMALDVKVDSPGGFDTWLAAQARPAPEPPASEPALARGRAVLENGPCAACHAVRGTTAQGATGPDLTHVGGRRTLAAGTLPFSRGALQGWISQPQAVKPGAMMPAVTLAPADLDALARYLESLK